MKKILFIICAFVSVMPVDLKLVGYLQRADGLGRIPFSIVDCIKDTNLSWSTIETRKSDKTYDRVYTERLNGADNGQIGVAILTDAIWYPRYDKYKQMPTNAKIKLAYSVFESDSIPAEWVKIFNNNFDGIVTTDRFEKESYQKAGVTIPIFVLPNPFYIESFFDIKRRKSIDPFVFGFSSGFWERKNYKKLIKAFVEEFGGNKNVRLRLHNRFRNMPISMRLLQEYSAKQIKNIEIINQQLSENEYQKFMSDLNCYVTVSKGEGFSIGPREAMAVGIPTIVTNNTAQKTICDSGCVLPVKSEIKEKAHYEIFRSHVGHYYDCEVVDIRMALREVYDNYELYCKKAEVGVQWAEQYKFENLKKRFQTLVRPDKIMLGDEDKIEDGVIVTSSESLYAKYKNLIN
jgi:glycosyltransferase involved in cell wall biosynthesis